ncbi:hypothetical protein PanWU01x14_309010 [Parasponia andersonii]|uniref:Uncharacterized protein n=1 Tax=Parasponia andersonii TaxID=3476 RepID=A0A2P5AQQ8_PARAD|nr:hypothetical protein PanWU01x14_309010 [Parasponia andersonii]
MPRQNDLKLGAQGAEMQRTQKFAERINNKKVIKLMQPEEQLHPDERDKNDLILSEKFLNESATKGGETMT